MSGQLISIVIPNYNGLIHLEICFNSIVNQSYKNYKVIFVDNNSSDNSIQYTENNFPQFEIIRNNHNTGFAKAVNIGIRAAIEKYSSHYILLLNNDIELEPDFLSNAIETFEKVHRADIVAVKMMNYFSRDIIDDTGNFLTKKGGTPYPRGNGQKDRGQFDKPEYIFGACAGAAFYRKEVFEKTGYFDESFFAYLEDIDFSFRSQLAGLKCYYNPKIRCYHKRGGSKISTHRFQVKMNERNVIWLRIKNYPIWLYLYYQPLFFLARIRKFVLLYKNYGFKTLYAAFSGYFLGIVKILFQIPKRIKIQRKRKVTAKYIHNLFR
jgi:GT2 family glycosyltransferase